MPLENEMKKPKTFIRTFGVLNIGMGVIVALYTGLGFFGYVRYGSGIRGSITFNLDEPLALAKSVQILLAIAIFFTHPIQCYVAIDIIWKDYLAPNLEKNSHKLLWEYVLRTSLVLFTCKWMLRVLHPTWRQFEPDRTMAVVDIVFSCSYRILLKYQNIFPCTIIPCNVDVDASIAFARLVCEKVLNCLL